jgi:uncharacterized membrane protein YdbT with pleckstrin-like domain
MSLQLSDGEHALFQGHPSWRSTLAFYVRGILGVAVAAALAAGITAIAGDGIEASVVAIVAVVLVVAVILVGYVRRMATTYTITNRRLHIKRGIVARRTQEARLERVQNVNTDQGPLERMLNVGTVDFDTAGTEDHGFKFDGVADPTGVVREVDSAQQEHAAELRAGGGEPRGAGL